MSHDITQDTVIQTMGLRGAPHPGAEDQRRRHDGPERELRLHLLGTPPGRSETLRASPPGGESQWSARFTAPWRLTSCCQSTPAAATHACED